MSKQAMFLSCYSLFFIYSFIKFPQFIAYNMLSKVLNIVCCDCKFISAGHSS